MEILRPLAIIGSAGWTSSLGGPAVVSEVQGTGTIQSEGDATSGVQQGGSGEIIFSVDPQTSSAATNTVKIFVWGFAVTGADAQVQLSFDSGSTWTPLVSIVADVTG